MKIKEVEQRVGMGRSNIRYYEREGLLHPDRDTDNNYREYTEEDVKQLQRIKVLRLLGVSPSDIKLLNAENITLEDVMKKRVEQMQDEVKEIQNLQKVCETIIERDIDIYSLNEDVLVGDQEEWKVRLKEILEHDMVKEVITRKQLNRHMMLSLVYGYFLNVIVAYFFGDFFLNYVRLSDVFENQYIFVPSVPMFVMMVIVILCSVGIWCEASVKWHAVIFHVSAIITTPLIIEFSRFYTDTWYAVEKDILLLRKFTGAQIAVFWLLIMSYVVCLYLISKVWDKLFTKVRYVLPIVAAFTMLYTAIAFALTGEVVIPAVAFGIMTLFIGVSWTTTLMDQEVYNRYYVVVASAKIMNVIGTANGQRGRGSQWAWMK